MSLRHSHRPRLDERGAALVFLMVTMAIAVVLISSFASWTAMHLKALRHTRQSELALLVAESGLEYYRWHLNHSPSDFRDGTGVAGPYVHSFTDKDGAVLGTYTLDITAPPTGSTMVTIKSTGRLTADPSVRRIVQATMHKPSLAKYAVVANDEMRFGAGTEVFGQIHSNRGIRFDGIAHNLITSAVATYDDPDHTGSDEFGVHTHSGTTDPLPPAAVPSRTDVFMAGRTFPVPSVDFAGISADLAQMKTDAQASGKYLSSSGQLGYRIVLKTNDTYDVYKVTSLNSPPSGCSESTTGWGTWSVNATSYQGNYANPTNGIIFVEDHVWVEGQINTARLTIAAAKFPESSSTWRSITVNNDLKYTNYDGQDAISLIAQNNFNVGLSSENDLRIDAAIIAQNGRAGRYYYDDDCGSNYERDTLTLYGMIATNVRYGFAYTDGTGYATRNLIYDSVLLYAPPPSFPLASSNYEVLTWKELRQ